MRKIRRNLLIFTGIAVSIPLIVYAMLQLTPESPVKEMNYARECLSDALKKQADTYSAELYNDARNSYDSAMAHWRKENDKFIFSRDYTSVLMFAGLSAEKAGLAAANSGNNTSVLKERLVHKIDTLNNLVIAINKFFSGYPLENEIRNRISKGKMLLKEAEVTFSRGHYLETNLKIIDSEYLLTTSFENASENIRNYFKSYRKWRTWADKTIKDSKRNADYSIIIDKFSRKLIVYLKGVRRYEFDAEFGKNWVGAKRMKGDNATPEGMYRVTKKLDLNRTKYHRALLLDYPNAGDLALFRKDVESGALPKSAKIGGLIEIHGNGGKGVDWTEGCIAITDEEMDVVFRIAGIGTPVTIVGSTTALPSIFADN